jgi:hypothetical protein
MTNVLRFDVKYGYDAYKNRFRDIIVNQENFMSNGLNPNEGQYDQDYYEGTTQNFIGSAFLDIDFQKDMNSSIPLKSVTMFKYDWRQRDYERTSAYGSGLPQFEHFTQEQVSNVVADAYKSVFRTYGFLINEKLEYADFVGASFGVRADWSSAFGEGSDPFIFPRGDFFLRVSELPFFSSLKNVIPEFKLRTAYGEAGIQPDPFDRIITLSTGTIGSGTYLTGQTSLTNPKLGVQVSKEFEVGADIAFTLGDDFMHYGQFNITYWDRKGEDVIEYIQIPTSTGGVEILDNAFAIESSGIQMSLDLNMLNTNKFKWNTVFNFGTSESILTYVSNGVPQAVGNNFVLKEGEPIGTFYGYMPLTSLDQLDAQGNRYIPESEVSNYSISSSGYVVHNDSKAVQFTSDKREVGNPQPDFNLSWINRFSFGNVVDLSVQVDMVQGKDIYNQTRQWQYRDMLHTDVTNPVSINGDNQPWAAYYRSLYQTNQPNAYFVEDGSYIRLRDVRLTFKLGELLDYAFLRNADLTIAGRNLFTITDYTGFDPEAASVDTDDTYVIGLDQYAFPNYKSYHIGLKIGF